MSPTLPCAGRLLAVLFLLGCALPAPAEARRRKKPKKTPLEQGVAQLNDMEDRKALASFKVALKTVKDNGEKASIHVYMGVAHYNLLNTNEARVSFRQALMLRPDAPLPEQVSPKIQAFFEGVKSEYKAEQAAKAKPKLKPKPKPKPKPLPPPDSRGTYKIAAWAMLGVAVAAAGAGLGMGLSGKSLEDDANDLAHPFGEAQVLHDQASTRYLVGNILYGVAGAAAITSGVLFYFGYRGAPEAQVALAPIEGGAMFQLQGVRW